MPVLTGTTSPTAPGDAGGRAARILVVEDDLELADAVRASLEDERYDVVLAYDGEQALELATTGSFDVVALDLLLPGVDGYEICAALRRVQPGVAVILVTALGAPDDVIRGFETGADDYLVKPFRMTELTARLRALLRRGGDAAAQAPEAMEAMQVTGETAVLQAGRLRLDLTSQSAWFEGLQLTLRPRERDLLEVFLRRPGLVLTRHTIRIALWGQESRVSDGALDRHLSQLRRKLAAAGAPAVIQTVFKIGWRLRAPEGH